MIDDSINYEYIVRYLRTMMMDRDPELRALRLRAEAAEVPISRPDAAAFLRLLCALHHPERILEIGTAVGYSALVMARACDAEIVTLERDEAMCAEARVNFARFGEQNRITLLEGDAAQTLDTLTGGFDFVFLDAAKAQYESFLQKIRLNEGGLLVCDNVLYQGMTATDELVVRRKITIVKRLRKFLDELTENPDFVTSLLPVGDGMAVAMKKTDKDRRK